MMLGALPQAYPLAGSLSYGFQHASVQAHHRALGNALPQPGQFQATRPPQLAAQPAPMSASPSSMGVSAIKQSIAQLTADELNELQQQLKQQRLQRQQDEMALPVVTCAEVHDAVVHPPNRCLAAASSIAPIAAPLPSSSLASTHNHSNRLLAAPESLPPSLLLEQATWQQQQQRQWQPDAPTSLQIRQYESLDQQKLLLNPAKDCQQQQQPHAQLLAEDMWRRRQCHTSTGSSSPQEQFNNSVTASAAYPTCLTTTATADAAHVIDGCGSEHLHVYQQLLDHLHLVVHSSAFSAANRLTSSAPAAASADDRQASVLIKLLNQIEKGLRSRIEVEDARIGGHTTAAAAAASAPAAAPAPPKLLAESPQALVAMHQQYRLHSPDMVSSKPRLQLQLPPPPLPLPPQQQQQQQPHNGFQSGVLPLRVHQSGSTPTLPDTSPTAGVSAASTMPSAYLFAQASSLCAATSRSTASLLPPHLHPPLLGDLNGHTAPVSVVEAAAAEAAALAATRQLQLQLLKQQQEQQQQQKRKKRVRFGSGTGGQEMAGPSTPVKRLKAFGSPQQPSPVDVAHIAIATGEAAPATGEAAADSGMVHRLSARAQARKSMHRRGGIVRPGSHLPRRAPES